MERKEIIKMLSMNYISLINYLNKKYGNVPGNYFVNRNCKTKNEKIRRTKEGLYIHHNKEDICPDLGNSEGASSNPFEYQSSENLVYCNILEHLILHIKIVETINEGCLCGVGGIENFIVPEINDYFNGYKEFQNYKFNSLNLINNNFYEYIECLEFYLDKVYEKKWLKDFGFGNTVTLSRGCYTEINEEIYSKLNEKARLIEINNIKNSFCPDFNTELCKSGKCIKENSRCRMKKFLLIK